MPTSRPRAYAVRRGALLVVRPAARAAVAAAALVLLAACGTTPAPSAGQPSPGAPSRATSPAPVRDVTAQPRAADGALDCPASLASAEGMAVPVRPQGVRGGERLLPDREPRTLVVCGYPVTDIMAATPLTAPFPRSTRAVLTGTERAEVVDLLTWAPRSTGRGRLCTLMAGNDTAYLVGATYDDAIVWVAATDDVNRCSRATNGDFVTSMAVGVDVAELVGARRAEPRGEGPCQNFSRGRLGDDESLAPPGDPRVVVCRYAADASSRATQLTRGAGDQVVAALRALPARPTDLSCVGSAKPVDTRFWLELSYPEGPSVRVSVDPGCRPQVVGTNLTVADAGGLVALVERWSPPIPGPDPDGSVSSPT